MLVVAVNMIRDMGKVCKKASYPAAFFTVDFADCFRQTCPHCFQSGRRSLHLVSRVVLGLCNYQGTSPPVIGDVVKRGVGLLL